MILLRLFFEFFKVDEIGISGVDGEALIGRISVACGGKGQDLPAFHAGFLQKVHKAKGLEYGAVILPYCSYAIDRMKRTDMNVSVFSGEAIRVGYQIKFDIDHAKATYQNDIFDEGMEKNERMREEARILYVAMTRAISSFSWISLEGRHGNCWQSLIWREQ